MKAALETTKSTTKTDTHKDFFGKTKKSNFFSPTTIQPKLTIGQPNDKYEKEADAMAEKIVAGQTASPTNTANVNSGIQRMCAGCEKEEGIQRMSEEEEEPDIQRMGKEEEIQPKLMLKSAGGGGVATAALSSQLNSSKGGGSPMSADTNQSMSQAFGTDFSRVRVHTGSSAVQMNQGLNARAFTHGSDVYFNKGEYNPGSREGKRLLGHELTHVVQQRGVTAGSSNAKRVSKTSGSKVQRGFWGKVWSGVKSIGKGIVSGAKSIGKGIASGISATGDALGAAWSAASKFVGVSASWAWEGMKYLGKTSLQWLSAAGSHVWDAIKWLGTKAWQGIKWLGAFLWEKLSLIGTNLWSFLSNIPIRLWKIVVHGWEGIKGFASWAWNGIKGASKHLWKGVLGVFNWLGEGIGGGLAWLMSGVQRGLNWAIDFIQKPSLSKLWGALTGSLSWVWQGLKGFAKWGWNGVVGAAIWAWSGAKGFASWIWEGIKRGGIWAGGLLLYVLDLIDFSEALQIIWGLIFRMRKLTQTEIDASLKVHPSGMIPYHLIRVDENSIISKIGGAYVTTFHVIHTPKGSAKLDVMVHEMTHIAQYEHIGSVYIPEAIHAQVKYGAGGGRGSKSAYDYERAGSLIDQRSNGKKFKDLNRESQAELVQDYYLCLTDTPPNPCLDLKPFINDMQNGEF